MFCLREKVVAFFFGIKSYSSREFCSDVAVHYIFATVFYFHLEELLDVTLNNESIFP